MSTVTANRAAAEISRYKERVAALYDLVEAAIRRVEPKANVSRTTLVHIDEELTGPYTVESLEAAIPDKPGIRLIPKGIYNIGARGRVDARSRLGSGVLVWVEAAGAAAGDADPEIELVTRPVFPGVPEGWAWTDDRKLALVPLTEQTFIDQVMPELLE